MISSFVIATIVVFVVGAGTLITLLVRAGERQSAGTIARVLYDAEHPETLR